MRADALIELPIFAEYWDYTVEQSDSGAEIYNYFKAADIKLMLTESTGGTPIVFCRDLLKFKGQLRNVRDQSGTTVLGLEAGLNYLFVGSPVAQLDVFGNVMGYKYRITKTIETVSPRA
jgi:hypothetical protein